MATTPNPAHRLPTGLCEDVSGEAAALIARMARGDGRALAELHAMWAPALTGIATRMLGDRRDAGKVVGDAFVRMWHRAADHQPQQEPPFVWAFALARDLCIARLRQRSQRNAPQSAQPQPPSHGEDPQVMPTSDWHRVRSAMDSLTAEERNHLENAVFLRYARSRAGKPHCPPSAADKSCLRLALDKVRNLLSRYEL